MARADQAEAAAVLARLVDAVHAGAIDADTPAERRMLYRLEGAAATLDAATRRHR